MPTKTKAAQQLLLLPLLLPLLLLSAAAGIASAEVNGHLHVHFVQYAVPDSRLASGRYCDSIKIFTWERRVSACDPQVNLCIGSGDPKSCTVGKISLPWVANSDLVNFGSRIGSKVNPVSLPFNNLPRTLSLGATIYDHDRVGSPDLIEKLKGSVIASRSKKTVLLSGRTHLKMEFWFTCNTNYYGYLCREFNYCNTKPCGHGTCTNLPDRYRCHCQTGWTGDRCDKAVKVAADPCAGHKASKFHECRVRYRFGRPQIYAVEHSTEPKAEGGRCVSHSGRRVVTGAEAKAMCHG